MILLRDRSTRAVARWALSARRGTVARLPGRHLVVKPPCVHQGLVANSLLHTAPSVLPNWAPDCLKKPSLPTNRMVHTLSGAFHAAMPSAYCNALSPTPGSATVSGRNCAPALKLATFSEAKDSWMLPPGVSTVHDVAFRVLAVPGPGRSAAFTSGVKYFAHAVAPRFFHSPPDAPALGFAAG